MPNIIEAATSLIGSLVDHEPKPPLHVGEVMSCWFYMGILEEAHAFETAGLNTTVHSDLRQALNDGVKLCQKQIDKLRKFMMDEGIPLPATSPEKPKSEPNQIPFGVKATDTELSNGMSLKVAGAVIHCAQSASQSIRNDVGMMFIEFQTEMMTYGVTLKTLMRKHGWLKVPPSFIPPGVPQN